MRAASTWTSGGARAGAATNSIEELLYQEYEGKKNDERTGKSLPDKFSCQPQERFFEVVVRFSRYFEVLEVLLSVESDCAGLYFSFLKRGDGR